MKNILIILLTLFSLQSFAQSDTVVVKVKGIPGVYNISMNSTKDSLIYYSGGIRYALPFTATVDLTPFVRKTDTANMLFSYATKDKVQVDSIALANAISGKKDNTDSTNSITGYTTLYQNSLKVSTAVANATYATIPNLNLKSDDNAVVHITRDENIQGTKTFNNSFQTSSDLIVKWGNGLAYGLLSWDNTEAIIGAQTGKTLSFYSNGTKNSALDLSGNFSAVGNITTPQTLIGRNIQWGLNGNGLLSYDANRIIVGAISNQSLSLWVKSGEKASLDSNGKFTTVGPISPALAVDSSNSPQLKQIYPSAKRWLIFGDSFSAHLDAGYPLYVINKVKFKGTVTNAVSGNTISQQSAKLDSILAANPAYLDSFNICSILIGINDFAQSKPLGTFADTAGTPTYAGLLKHMIEKILTAKPSIELYIMTPPEANGAGVSYKATNLAGWTVKQLSVLISQICYSYAVQCIDLYAFSQFNLFTIPTLTGEGLHPNALGAAFIGDALAAAFINRTSSSKFYGLNDITNVDSLSINGINIGSDGHGGDGYIKLKRDGTVWFGVPGKQGVLSWDTLPGGTTYKTLIGSQPGQSNYALSFWVDGKQRAIIDTLYRLRVDTGGRFVYSQHPTFTAADSLAAPDKKYVDSLNSTKLSSSFRDTLNLKYPIQYDSATNQVVLAQSYQDSIFALIHSKDSLPDWPNDSVAVVNGGLHLHSWYRTGNIVKMVISVPAGYSLRYEKTFGDKKQLAAK